MAGQLTPHATSSEVAIDDDLTVTGTTTVSTLTHVGTTLGFFSTSPTTRPSAYTQTFSTATKTHATRTASALVDNTGGTRPASLEPTADGTANDNFSSLNEQLTKTQADSTNTAQVLNSVIDSLQALGLLQ